MTTLWSWMAGVFMTKKNRKPARRSVRSRLGLETLEDRTALSNSPVLAVHGPAAPVVASNAGPPPLVAAIGAPPQTGSQGSVKYPHIVITMQTTTVKAGTLVTFTVTAYNPNGTVFTGYADKVNFSIADPKATFFSDAKGLSKMLTGSYTFTGAGTGHDNGTHTFSMILSTPGLKTLTITDVANALVTTNHTVSVA